MFDRMGVVEATYPDAHMDIETVAIEAGAQSVEPLEAEEVPAGHTGARFICNPTDLDAVSSFLTSAKWTVTLFELSYIAKTPTEVAPDVRTEVTEFLSALDDHDDVHRIFAALK